MQRVDSKYELRKCISVLHACMWVCLSCLCVKSSVAPCADTQFAYILTCFMFAVNR